MVARQCRVLRRVALSSFWQSVSVVAQGGQAQVPKRGGSVTTATAVAAAATGGGRGSSGEPAVFFSSPLSSRLLSAQPGKWPGHRSCGVRYRTKQESRWTSPVMYPNGTTAPLLISSPQVLGLSEWGSSLVASLLSVSCRWHRQKPLQRRPRPPHFDFRPRTLW